MADKPKRYPIEAIRSKFQTVALDNAYQVFFQPNGEIQNAANKVGVDPRFIAEDLGLYVSDAVLPGSSFADIEIAGDRQGITERNAFSRIYDDVTFSFYVDREYRVIKFFEAWNQYVNPLRGAKRKSQIMVFNYPDDYKCDITIYKFNKDYFKVPLSPFDYSDARRSVLGYTFFRAWPYSMASTPVSYEGASVLQLNVTFRYDRYIMHDVTSTERSRGDAVFVEDLNTGEFNPAAPTQPEPKTEIPFFDTKKIERSFTFPLGPNDFLNLGNPALDQFGVRDQYGRPPIGAPGPTMIS